MCTTTIVHPMGNGRDFLISLLHILLVQEMKNVYVYDCVFVCGFVHAYVCIICKSCESCTLVCVEEDITLRAWPTYAQLLL